MPTLRFRTKKMLASSVGGENSLPDLRRDNFFAGSFFDQSKLTPQQIYTRDSHIFGCLPYRIQDTFDRSEVMRPMRVAELENDQYLATFLLDLGGRLWSLVHKPSGRELLYQPDVLNFVNIGICQRWFCGGVEWNVAVCGHAAYTSSPVYAAAVQADGAGGGPGLRIWEWDRFRDAVFQIDFYLPDDVPALLARPRIINTRNETTPMYWWSNVTVLEAPGHRVLAPATQAFQYDYGLKGIVLKPIPILEGKDVTYPAVQPSAHDYFYDIPAGQRPWETSLDGEGRGLVHASTSRLVGRKLFLWGQGPGGKRWQGYLGGRNGRGYIEIQAGLGKTQAQYLPMPANATWEWLEAYALMEADPAVAHGPDWAAATGHINTRLNALLPQERLESLLADTAGAADRPPEKVAHRGSAWGGMQQRLRKADRLPPAAGLSGVKFPTALPKEFADWQALLATGQLPEHPPAETPPLWVTGRAWRRRLAAAVAGGGSDHWLAWLHLGVMAFRQGDCAAAEMAWQTSLQRQPSAWAYRNLAVLAKQDKKLGEAAELYLNACRLNGQLQELQIECGRALLDAGRLADLAQWLTSVPEHVRQTPRMQLASAWAAYQNNELDQAEKLLFTVELSDIREGETILTDLWFAIQAKRIAAAEGIPLDEALDERVRTTLTPPPQIDFRMKADGEVIKDAQKNK
jgi:tetratricopeptide (TPR) repeat protein